MSARVSTRPWRPSAATSTTPWRTSARPAGGCSRTSGDATDRDLARERSDTDLAVEQTFSLLKDETAAHADTREMIVTREEFLAIVSHDLRTPLNVIAVSAAVLAEQLGGHARPGDQPNPRAHAARGRSDGRHAVRPARRDPVRARPVPARTAHRRCRRGCPGMRVGVRIDRAGERCVASHRGAGRDGSRRISTTPGSCRCSRTSCETPAVHGLRRRHHAAGGRRAARLPDRRQRHRAQASPPATCSGSSSAFTRSATPTAAGSASASTSRRPSSTRTAGESGRKAKSGAAAGSRSRCRHKGITEYRMATKHNSLTLGKAQDDEPIFVLRARTRSRRSSCAGGPTKPSARGPPKVDEARTSPTRWSGGRAEVPDWSHRSLNRWRSESRLVIRTCSRQSPTVTELFEAS